MSSTSQKRTYLIAVAAGLLYGFSLRLILHWPHFWSGAVNPANMSPFWPTDLWVMTFGFLVVVPFVMGWIVISFSQIDDRHHWAHWLFSPWLTILLSDLCVLVAGYEGGICLLFALPITFFISSIGGLSAGLTRRRQYLNRRSMTVCLAVLPLLLSAIEMRFDGPLQLRTVQTSILIHAPVSTVWQNVERVPAIQPSEIRQTWTHLVGFPLPVEATLDREGVGGVRHASFQHGLVFIETITSWQPEKSLAFTIAADTVHIPPNTLDEHVTIGGRYFDVLNGEYRLEQKSNGEILLHLSSQERLSTDFNAYAALWSDAVMSSLQQSILEVVKHRCEAEARTASARLNP